MLKSILSSDIEIARFPFLQSKSYVQAIESILFHKTEKSKVSL